MDVHTNLQVGYKFVVYHGAVVVEVLRVGRIIRDFMKNFILLIFLKYNF